MDSLAIFPETLRREVELHIVGSGSLEGSLRERASQLGVQAQVHFHGFVPLGPDLEKHYDEAALFVLPSKSEGFPQVILEAMAAGLPVIATHVGGIPSVLKDGSSAILIRPGDPRALASAAEKILTDSSLYERLSAGSLELARRHTLEAERDRMIDSIRAHLGAGMVPG